jgi:hypothetical protein
MVNQNTAAEDSGNAFELEAPSYGSRSTSAPEATEGEPVDKDLQFGRYWYSTVADRKLDTGDSEWNFQ